ncbi:hypothetical protein ANAPRD1_00341 [Anaplasma phagocytophilum]|uniref:hypothetical protein n=1 Tax=Anaplasma phagocytophilum TaxID=948 RepID=UPI0007DFA585|nr:hypothetical protein [Anaplasma phagocytophilum]SCV63105.1 hypothetical protein ANAPRD1_00341 [Anaplasma phagocytophilum]SCV65432.1 hypothetical protein ANAPH2_01262 [Anaplasma phagocytophilum]
MAGLLAKTIEGGEVVVISYLTIDGKVCNGSHAAIGGESASTTRIPDLKTNTSHTAQCSGLGCSSAEEDQKLLSRFVSTLGIAEDTNWPTGQVGHSGNAKEGPTNSNSEAVAIDLTKLSSEEKTIVAGLLAKTIEGGVRLLRLGRFLLPSSRSPGILRPYVINLIIKRQDQGYKG